MGRLKTIKLLILKVSFNLIYQCFYYLSGPRKQQITFATMRSTQLNDNLKALYAEYQLAGHSNLVTFCYHYDRSFKSKVGFLWASLRALRYMATSRLFIIDDYFFPLYAINKHDQNQVVQLWHAIGALKKFGLSLPNANRSILKPHTNYDWVFVNTENDRPFYVDAFDVTTDQVIASGEPMLDEMVKETTQSQTSERPILLYAPTYRPAVHGEEQVLALVQAFIEASPQLQQSWEIYISVHPYVNLPSFKLPRHVHVFQDPDRIKALLPQSKLLITDYSSLSLNFSYFERPILLFTPDYQAYQRNCGFYVDYYSYLGAPHFSELASLMTFINHDLTNLNLDYVKRLKAKTFPRLDGRNTQRVYQFLTHLD
ncbi:CDP-glycerol glycerophosphotransferase family protein [Lactiplantibacillus modestisalitolerans]|uniref:CDP-glycerol glycerophosphotransferase family protein n=1 Tax=Lactiplantibacillus modestisalitolerans TaxID=1457219 RepID=A0ABV5WX26_9LACO|nr:CDP-glycerol glycerophosphotransferase family protein [Lactiplantibacillus modestisalitolerans]